MRIMNYSLWFVLWMTLVFIKNHVNVICGCTLGHHHPKVIMEDVRYVECLLHKTLNEIDYNHSVVGGD